MENGYYHGYLAESQISYALADFNGKIDYGTVFMRRGRGFSIRVGDDDEVSPVVALIDVGETQQLLAGATMGLSMLSRLSLEPLAPLLAEGEVHLDRQAWELAWQQARVEVESWADELLTFIDNEEFEQLGIEDDCDE